MALERNPSYLVDENLRPAGAHEQHGPPQGVAVAVELLRAHGVEEVVEDSAHVAVHPLQGHVQPQPGHLVHEGLQTPDIWDQRRGQGQCEDTVLCPCSGIFHRELEKHSAGDCF